MTPIQELQRLLQGVDTSQWGFRGCGKGSERDHGPTSSCWKLRDQNLKAVLSPYDVSPAELSRNLRIVELAVQLATRYAPPGWIPVTEALPKVQKINGYWDTVPVQIAFADHPPTVAVFTLVGGDEYNNWNDDLQKVHEPFQDIPYPVFRTDEGIQYEGVTHWAPILPPPESHHAAS